jgi:oxygen-independent coproporphyrinogen-3 oxidase
VGIGLYIHFPFCLRKCHYCDFVSFPLPGLETVDRYLHALALELALAALMLTPDRRVLTSVYLGGGTPTCLEEQQLVGILKEVGRYFTLEQDAEITVEANPGTLTAAKLAVLKKAGVNRVSLGAQSFHDGLLKQMGRMHQAAQTVNAFEQARRAGFNNINLDLIYGLPEQQLADWEQTLISALGLGPEHLSVYGLALEPETYWGALQSRGQLVPADEELVLLMRALTVSLLAAAGYRHYELANYARPGFESRHNVGYWCYREYLGVGIGAASLIAHRRWSNVRELEQYCQNLSQGRLPVGECEHLTPDQEMAEYLFLGLRLRAGISLQDFYQRFGVRAEERYQVQLNRLQKMQLIRCEGDRLSLTPRALPVANEVFCAFV